MTCSKSAGKQFCEENNQKADIFYDFPTIIFQLNSAIISSKDLYHNLYAKIFRKRLLTYHLFSGQIIIKIYTNQESA